jgi:hypothetical protein
MHEILGREGSLQFGYNSKEDAEQYNEAYSTLIVEVKVNNKRGYEAGNDSYLHCIIQRDRMETEDTKDCSSTFLHV